MILSTLKNLKKEQILFFLESCVFMVIWAVTNYYILFFSWSFIMDILAFFFDYTELLEVVICGILIPFSLFSSFFLIVMSYSFLLNLFSKNHK
jgi:hypothetical protein